MVLEHHKLKIRMNVDSVSEVPLSVPPQPSSLCVPTGGKGCCLLVSLSKDINPAHKNLILMT